MAKILFKRGLSTNVASLVLDNGEPALTTDTKKLYIGTPTGNILINPDYDTGVISVNGKTGVVVLAKGDVGLGNVDNTTDSAKVVASAGKLTTARSISLSGAVTGSASFDGSAAATIATTLTNITLSKITDAGTAASKDVGTASGNVPILGSDGKLNDAVLPALAITDTFVVASQAAMLALTAQTGDVAVRTDTSQTFILKATPASTLANWVELLFPTTGVVSVNGRTGAVTLTKTDVGLANVDNTADTSKNVLSATKLTTARTINGVSFDGTANITVADSTKAPLASPALTGTPTAPTAATTTSSTQIATTAFVKNQGYLTASDTIDGGTF